MAISSFLLSAAQKDRVIGKTLDYIDLANQHLSLQLPNIAIRFDLTGKSSGMFVVKFNEIYIRYNEIIFSRYFDDALINTVAHEVAHYVVHDIWGIKKTRPHGTEWQKVMALFDVKPEVTSRYDISGLPLKQQKQYQYVCDCMQHTLSTTRHNRVQNKRAIYKCRQCYQPLTLKCISIKS